MKQVIQPLDADLPVVIDVPAPQTRRRQVLVQTAASLVSAGTERMVVDFAEKNLLAKARSRPDLVRQTWEKAQREGLLTTVDAVRSRLAQPMALGYSSAGVVIDVGGETPGLVVGDRVACAGGGYAVHAEVVSVPRNLVVKLPDGVSLEAAAFTTLGAIALQGIRLAEVKLGEVAAVLGLGLLGQLAVQMLKAAGCAVIGMDIQPGRVELARRMGADAVATSAEELEAVCLQFSGGQGVDAVLITADTKSNQPVEVAGVIARAKGVVVAVGAVGMQIPRKVYYEKELAFHVSRSYGPGRYDFDYEEKGQDYPYAYVRWTEQRNMEAFVNLVAAGRVDVTSLITHRFPVTEAPRAYELITGKTGERFLGVVLTYPDAPAPLLRVVTLGGAAPGTSTAPPDLAVVALGVLGAGNFANATLLPALKAVDGLQRMALASGSGLSAQTAAQRFGFAYATTDEQVLLNDPAINTVAILTRHQHHARQVLAALAARKHVFVEKPLCLDEEELEAIAQAYASASASAPAPYLMVGFNRRFAPFVRLLKKQVAGIQEPLVLQYRVNAGYIPPEHWLHDPAQGGGRLVGEACHFIDLVIYLAADRPVCVTTRALPDSGRYRQDNLVITLEFAGGGLGVVTYVANGDRGFGKERLEVFGGGLAASMDDYRVLSIRKGGKGTDAKARLRQDKGHQAEWQALTGYLTGKGPEPMSFADINRTMQTTFAARRSLETGVSVSIEE